MATKEKGIRKRGKKFIVDVTVNGIRRTQTCSTMDEALKARETLEMSLREGKPIKKTSDVLWTLEQAYNHCVENVWRGRSGEKASTINARTALDYFGKNKVIAELEYQDLINYTKYLEAQSLADTTINRKMSALSKMWTEAERAGKTGGKARPKIERRRERKTRFRFLSQDEQDVMEWAFNHLGMRDHADVFNFYVRTGMRPSEIWRLTLADIDFQRKKLTIWKTKTDRPRTIPFGDIVSEIIKRRTPHPETGQLFPYNNRWFRTGWDKAKRAAGLGHDEELIPYCCRHTACTRLVHAGVDLPRVQAFMGHTSIETTQRYWNIEGNHLENLASVLD